MPRAYADRSHAGVFLASKLSRYARRDDVIVLGLPRGGVPVAFEVATALAAPLDVLVVRKLGVPGQPELAMGAIASGGVRVLNETVLRAGRISEPELARVSALEEAELARRELAYRGTRPRPEIEGKTVILVDDGLATGSTMRAAVAAVRQLGPAAVVVAVPAGAPSTCRELAALADEVVCAISPPDFYAVGSYYEDFSQTTDEEIRALLGGTTEA